MYLFSIGKWGTKSGYFLVWNRVYFKGYIWTPFCKVRKRYKEWFGFWITRKLYNVPDKVCKFDKSPVYPK